MAIKSVKLETSPARIALAAAAFLCLLGIFFFTKWCLGNAVASHTSFREVADFAVSLAPNDPQTHYTSAILFERAFTPDDLNKSIAEYEQATALAPNDFRTWLALGKARERNEDAAGAERALRKSLELAPNYSEVAWTLGNILLREGKREEAFAEIRRAAENDSRYVDPAVSTAWQIFDGDLTQISRFLGGSAAINSVLVEYLAKENRLEDAVKIWNALPDEKMKTDFATNGRNLFNKMLEAKKYRAALQVSSQIGDASAGNFAVGQIFNGNFETDIKTSNASIFEWQIQEGIQPQIGIDNAQRHGGERSLFLAFNSQTGREFRPVSQIIALEPGRKYVFEAFYKSELKTAATVQWEIFNVADGKILATTQAIAAAASDWTNLKAEFTLPENSEAVALRLAREPCKSTLCPISGKIWFDDLSIK